MILLAHAGGWDEVLLLVGPLLALLLPVAVSRYVGRHRDRDRQ